MIKPERTKEDLVIEPEDLNDDEALREYGRQLALDSLLRDIAPDNIVEMPSRAWNRRAWISASAASVASIVGFSLWKFSQQEVALPKQISKLDPLWILEKTSDAEFEILDTNHIKLISGEIRLTSKEPANILVETPSAKATAMGTDFLIGALQTKQPNNQVKNMKINTLTRLLVLTGTVTLATTHGVETAAANEAIVANGDLAPEKILVQANSDFAFDLYSQLSKKHKEDNLFFSPYSISSTLMMVAEGAREETAKEMGTVLGFPKSLTRSGEGSQNIPWEMSVIRSGQLHLNKCISNKEDLMIKQQKLIDEEASITKELNKLKVFLDKADGDKAFYNANKEEYREASRKMGNLNSRKFILERDMGIPQLHSANSVWVEQTLNIKDTWRDKITNVYSGGAVQNADFREQREDERMRINEWVAQQTQNNIKTPLGPDALDPRTVLVLANAIYFKADWEKPFEQNNTKRAHFTLSSGKNIKTQVMTKYKDHTTSYAAFNADGSFFKTPSNMFQGETNEATYPDKDGFAMLEMPYNGHNMSMVILSPNDPQGLPALEKKLNATNVDAWIAKLERRTTKVHLPKFKLTRSYGLSDTLSAMGMPSAFEENRANFSGISDDEPSLFIDDVVHEAFLTVNERGTEAGAATVIPALKLLAFSSPVFKADRPFIYLIRERKSGTILFLGRILDPTK